MLQRKVPTVPPKKSKDKNSAQPNRVLSTTSGRSTRPLSRVTATPPVFAVKTEAHRSAAAKPPVLPARDDRVDQEGSSSFKALARTAVGKGIRHGYTAADCHRVGPRKSVPSMDTSSEVSKSVDASQQSTPKQPPAMNDPLSQLASNYRNSLMEIRDNDQLTSSGLLSRDSSLLDLAMIPDVDDGAPPAPETSDINPGFTFVDFPNPEVQPQDEGETQDGTGEQS